MTCQISIAARESAEVAAATYTESFRQAVAVYTRLLARCEMYREPGVNGHTMENRIPGVMLEIQAAKQSVEKIRAEWLGLLNRSRAEKGLAPMGGHGE